MIKKFFCLGFVLLLISASFVFSPTKGTKASSYGKTSTYLGRIYSGDGGKAKSAYLDFPEDVAFTPLGKMVIADTYNNVIRRIDTSGKIFTIAGTGSYGYRDGAASSSEFALPKAVAVGNDGAVYVADTYNHKIRKIKSGTVTTLVSSGLSYPEGVAVFGSTLYISDTGGNAIKKVSTSGGPIMTITSSVKSPKKLIPDSTGQYLYVVDSGHYKVVKVRISDGKTELIAGSGSPGYREGRGAAAKFRNIVGVTYDSARNVLFVTDGNGYTDYVRKIDLSTNTTSLLATDEVMATINYPKGIASYGDYVYVANSGIGTIQKFHKDTGATNIQDDRVAGKNRFGHDFGSKAKSILGRPQDMVFSPDKKYIYLAENNFIRRINVADASTSFIIGSVVDAYREDKGSKARFSSIAGITINSSGSTLYVADRWNNRIRGIDLSTKTSFLVSGAGKVSCSGSCNGYKEGKKNTALFNNPAGIVISPDDNFLYVTDVANNRIRKVRISDGKTELIAGSGEAGDTDGVGSAAKFNRPFGITIDAEGKNLYIADTNNHRIRRVNIETKQTVTVAGSGLAGYRDGIGRTAYFSYPEYVKMGADGNLYVTEAGGHKVRFIDLATSSVRLVAGSGERGFKNGSSTSAEFNNPKGLLPDTESNILYIADNWNDLIRKIEIKGEPPYQEPAPQVSSLFPQDREIVSSNPSETKYLGISGANFRHGAQVLFGDFESLATYVNSSSSITVKIPFGKMAPGYYDVKVTNVDGQSATLVDGFIVLNADGSLPSRIKKADLATYSFFAYSEQLRGGFFSATGDLTGDSASEVVIGAGQGFGPQVQVFDKKGNLISSFFVYAEHLRSGVRPVVCDTDGDGQEEIVVAPGAGGRPHIRIFSGEGKLISPGFFALDGQFQGGANIACGDVNADGKDEILVAASQGGGPHVTVHNADGQILANFMAYNVDFRGGVKITTADINGDGREEIVTGPELGAPHLIMFSIQPGQVKKIIPGFYAFHPDFRGGLSLAGADVNADGKEEIVVGQRSLGQAWVKVYSGLDQIIIKEILAYDSTFEGGSEVAAGDIDLDGRAEVITVPGSGGGPQVKIFDI